MSFEAKTYRETTVTNETVPTVPLEEYPQNALEREASYHARIEKIKSQQIGVDAEIQKLEDLATTSPELGLIENELNIAYAKKERLLTERVIAESNYLGDWTDLLHNRILDPLTKEKFILQRTEALEAMNEGAPSLLEKRKTFRTHYEDQVQNYVATVASVFSKTNIGNAVMYNKQPYHLGTGKIGEEGAVFDDAEHADGSALTERQKNIIEAHEKGHGLRDFTSPIDSAELRGVLDTEVLEKIKRSLETESDKRFSTNYLNKPDEIAERMAQLKNYFGMKADGEFTKAHLDYVREHYVSDTGLDNSMNTFLSCISTRTEKNFLSVINRYPL